MSTSARPASSSPALTPTCCCARSRPSARRSCSRRRRVWISLLRSSLRPDRPVLAAQGLLRRLADAGRGAARDAARLPNVQAVELLRPDGDGAAGDDPAARGPGEQAGSAGRPALNVETRLSTTMSKRWARARSARSCTERRTRRSATGTTSAKTAEAFDGGWFHSGDLGRLDEDGYLFIVDRKKDMVKTGGENVASSEVEETIYRSSEVSEVAVFGVPDPRWIEAVVAAVVPRAVAHWHPRPSSPLPVEAGRLQDPEARRRASTACRRTRAASCSSASCASAYADLAHTPDPSPRGQPRHGARAAGEEVRAPPSRGGSSPASSLRPWSEDPGLVSGRNKA